MGGRISAHKVSKQYRSHASSARTLKDVFVGGLRRRPSDYFWALKNVSFEVGAGQLLGVIGRNGSGKSTLLRMAGGIGRPDEGTVRCDGRIGSMLDLGLGFHPDLTGEENVFINGVIYGLTRAEIRERMAAIVKFSELERFMRSPLRTYSSGMRLRLAFAVAAHCEPEVLLIDEVLAVGDLPFQNKCLERIHEFQSRGCAIMLVSHDINQVRRLADRVLWLDQGQVVAAGRPAIVTDKYLAVMEGDDSAEITGEMRASANGEGGETSVHSKEIEITRVRLLRPDGEPTVAVQPAAGCVVEVHFRSHRTVAQPIFLVSVTRADGEKCFQVHTDGAGVDTTRVPKAGTLRVAFDRLDLCEGDYFVDVGVFEREWKFAYDYAWHALALKTDSDSGSEGIYDPPARWEFRNGAAAG